LREKIEDAIGVLKDANTPEPTIFRRESVLVRLVSNGLAPALEALDPDSLLGELVSAADWPVEPRAKGVLRNLALRRGVRNKTVLGELMPRAVLLAIDDLDRPQPIRDGSGKGSYYVKNLEGRKTQVLPSEHFDLAQLEQFEAHLKRQVRNLVEEDLVDRDCVDNPGKAATIAPVEEIAPFVLAAAHTSSPEILMMEAVERKEREAAVNAALLSLTPREFEIVEFIKEKGYLPEEISRELNISRDTVRVHFKNIRQKFLASV